MPGKTKNRVSINHGDTDYGSSFRTDRDLTKLESKGILSEENTDSYKGNSNRGSNQLKYRSNMFFIIFLLIMLSLQSLHA